ncbi:4-(cytidine 5'-diphospho)-2-C-methyl-D-erythritol kinase [Sphingobacteriaceae bacterium WQ 2009]|uniref:4-diphosphocytidyl-2-C-methyl-D-erythritol kinase n=1 Tax=Rhinopithecimicrobium faecis TaxID=2820698 RepID=A0A8T4H9Y9_9SPHI|nr:4-(cytidine 5'-diphospho)-2-C-methyl-D-erythritol kinase [Sphingobacteriaceae bacterium WQ 2009]
MIAFANAKLNLGLYITNKRADGYHDLETIFCPLPIYDVVELVENGLQETRLFTSGIEIPYSADNLCIKAFKLLKQHYDIPYVDIYLYKNIPIGAGLGGGSSDAAYVLNLLNNLFSLAIPVEELERLAGTLGADCSFFIQNKPAYAVGIGTTLSPIDLDLSSYYIVTIKPDIHISTAEAYASVTPKEPQSNLLRAVQLPIQEWKYHIRNDFEEGIFEKYPLIKSLKETLYEEGAIYAAMSGSGSAVYAIFWEPVNLDHLSHFGTIYYPTKTH